MPVTHTTTFASNPTGLSKDGNRHQNTLESIFPNSPLMGETPQYKVDTDPQNPAQYPVYKQLLLNGFTEVNTTFVGGVPVVETLPFGGQDQSKTYWGFTARNEVDLTFNPGNFSMLTLEEAGQEGQFAFAPNLKPPSEPPNLDGQHTAFNASANTPILVARPEWLTREGWNHPLTPRATSSRISKNTKPQLRDDGLAADLPTTNAPSHLAETPAGIVAAVTGRQGGSEE